MVLRPVVLEGKRLRLEPLEPHHVDTLWAVAEEADLWTYMMHDVRTKDDLADWIQDRRAVLDHGTGVPFLQCDRKTGHAIGSTSLFEYDAKNRLVEIGHTWLATTHRGSGVNLEAKRLLFAHAFDDLGLNRVQLKCDARNTRSRAAILRIGATFEGILRAHRLLSDGHVRDTAMYSVTRPEWPMVRECLDGLLERLPLPEP